MRRTSPRAQHREPGARDDVLELLHPVVPPVGRLAQARDLVERLVDGLVHHRVEHDDATLGLEHAEQFLERGHRLGQQVERVAAQDEVERGVLVGQRVEVDERERDVDEAELGGQALALLQEVRELVGGLDRRHVGRHDEPGHARPRWRSRARRRWRRAAPGRPADRAMPHAALPRLLPSSPLGGRCLPPGRPPSAVGDGEDGTRHAETDTDLVTVHPRRLDVVAGGARRARTRWRASRP